jgi:hypothetical protein
MIKFNELPTAAKQAILMEDKGGQAAVFHEGN